MVNKFTDMKINELWSGEKYSGEEEIKTYLQICVLMDLKFGQLHWSCEHESSQHKDAMHFKKGHQELDSNSVAALDHFFFLNQCTYKH